MSELSASPSTPRAPVQRRPLAKTLLAALPAALLLGAVAGALAWSAAGTTLGLWFGGVLLSTVLVPPLVAGEEGSGAALAAGAAVVMGVAGVWFAATITDAQPEGTRMTDCIGCALVLAAYACLLCGTVRILQRLRVAPALAAFVAVLIGLAWLTWPVWLSTALGGHDRLIVLLSSAHPLLAINARLRHLGLWQQQRLAYTLTNLNQDVALPLPASLLPAIILHSLIGCALLAAASMRRRSARSAATADAAPGI